MGQKFTNVSYAKPLWKYANNVYSGNKAAFLNFQNTEQLCVNDLIALGFCLNHQLKSDHPWWQNPDLQSLRVIIGQLRTLRDRPEYRPYRDIILDIELRCEQQDLDIIAESLVSDHDNSLLFEQYCAHYTVANASALKAFIASLNPKKGA
ncbi:hypothetical protein ACFOND_05200 [Reinekea marina]|uniref:Uncharacterized protein n=2 Tax=Reinekea marina TaxID=1310421 RepID=A0ABV7WP58_9GAMM